MNPNSLILGGLCLGSSLNETDSYSFLQKAYELGIRDIDTGSLYGNGDSEQFISNYQIQTNNHFNIHTKIGLERLEREDGSFGVALDKLSSEYIIKATKKSINKLKVEKLHKVSLHAFCKDVPIREQIDALNFLISEDLIDSYGICNYEVNELREWISECIKWNLPLRSLLDVHFNLFEQRAAFDIFPILDKYSIAAIPHRIFCRGLLTNRYLNHNYIPEKSRASFSWRVKRYITETNIGYVNDLRNISKLNKIDLLTLVLTWIFSFKCISKVCIGTSSESQLREIIKANKNVLENGSDLIKQIASKHLPKEYSTQPEDFFET